MKSLLVLLIFIFPFTAIGQNIGGSWYGRADVMVQGNHSNYLTELNVKQRGNEIEGVMGYYFKNQYQSFIVRGSYNPQTRTVKINDVPIMYYNSSASMPAVHCMMDLEAQLSISQIKSSLKGYFLSEAKYRYTCPDIDIRLTKNTDENTDSLLKNAVTTTRMWVPAPDEVVVNTAALAVAVPASGTAVQSPSTAVLQTPALINPSSASETLTQSFQQRKPYLINEIFVESDSIRISLYDNGDIDGDTVSVFYNKIPVLTKQGLDAQGVNLFFTLDPSIPVHEISLFAENLGSIPPNTALMIIHDGINRYELFSTSNMNLNGTVRIRRKK